MAHHFFPGEHQPSYNNFNMQEGAWSPDPSPYPYAIDPHQYACTQDTPQFIDDGAAPPPYHPTPYETIHSPQGYPPSSNHYYTYEEPIHHVVIAAADPRGGRVHDPSPNQHSQSNQPPPPPSREEIPQRPYECGNTQKRDQKPPIPFSKWGCPGVNLADALKRKFEGVDDRDTFPFGNDRSGITVRLHFPGYPSTTKVEKTLRSSERPRAKSMQVATKDYKALRHPVTKERLVREVSKRIKWYIEDLLKHSDLFPFDEMYEEKWRLGQGMKFEHMTIIRLDNVSNGSWSPVICIDCN